MADNVGYTPGSGATVRAKLIGGILTQVLQIDIGGETAEILLTGGVQNTANSLPVAIASDQSPVPVAGSTVVLTPTCTVTASAYSAGNNVGGKLTLTGALRTINGTGLLESISITDHANQKAPLDIVIFSANPAATFTDKSAFPTLSAADDALILGRVSIAVTDYVTVGGSAMASIRGLGLVLAGTDSSTSLYMAINTSGTPTFAATSDLKVAMGILRD